MTKAAMKRLLVVNTGSSSVKFRLFGISDDLPLIAGGKITEIGGDASFKAKLEGGAELSEKLPADTTHETAIFRVLSWLDQSAIKSINAVAHRIVHGGDRYADPVLLDDKAIEYLRSLNSLAPLHQPHNLSGVDILQRKMPHIVQYGCFDTAFHARHEELFSTFALPENIRGKGVKRYGFHGLSYDWIAHKIKEDLPHLEKARIVVAHLGNGASLCAMKDGKSIDTTMGMTALDGLPMGTRCGAIDAGAVIYMIRDLQLDVGEVERLLYEDSGLKGLSGLTNDVKTLSGSHSERAAFSLDYFSLKTAQHIVAMAVSIGGIDGLIFTGGIGENAPDIRQKILGHLSFLPAFEHHVIAANEERSMALEIFERFRKDF